MVRSILPDPADDKGLLNSSEIQVPSAIMSIREVLLIGRTILWCLLNIIDFWVLLNVVNWRYNWSILVGTVELN